MWAYCPLHLLWWPVYARKRMETDDGRELALSATPRTPAPIRLGHGMALLCFPSPASVYITGESASVAHSSFAGHSCAPPARPTPSQQSITLFDSSWASPELVSAHATQRFPSSLQAPSGPNNAQ
jgi:hypothetical protein